MCFIFLVVHLNPGFSIFQPGAGPGGIPAGSGPVPIPSIITVLTRIDFDTGVFIHRFVSFFIHRFGCFFLIDSGVFLDRFRCFSFIDSGVFSSSIREYFIHRYGILYSSIRGFLHSIRLSLNINNYIYEFNSCSHP